MSQELAKTVRITGAVTESGVVTVKGGRHYPAGHLAVYLKTAKADHPFPLRAPTLNDSGSEVYALGGTPRPGLRVSGPAAFPARFVAPGVDHTPRLTQAPLQRDPLETAFSVGDPSLLTLCGWFLEQPGLVIEVGAGVAVDLQHVYQPVALMGPLGTVRCHGGSSVFLVTEAQRVELTEVPSVSGFVTAPRVDVRSCGEATLRVGFLRRSEGITVTDTAVVALEGETTELRVIGATLTNIYNLLTIRPVFVDSEVLIATPHTPIEFGRIPSLFVRADPADPPSVAHARRVDSMFDHLRPSITNGIERGTGLDL